MSGETSLHTTPARSSAMNETTAATTGPGDEMLTKQELAAKLKVSVRCIENWQRAGHLPFIKIASVVLFHWPDVVTHLKTHFHRSGAETRRNS